MYISMVGNIFPLWPSTIFLLMKCRGKQCLFLPRESRDHGALPSGPEGASWPAHGRTHILLLTGSLVDWQLGNLPHPRARPACYSWRSPRTLAAGTRSTSCGSRPAWRTSDTPGRLRPFVLAPVWPPPRLHRRPLSPCRRRCCCYCCYSDCCRSPAAAAAAGFDSWASRNCRWYPHPSAPARGVATFY